jgi:hypothetical protein
MTSIAARRLPARVARGWVLPVTLFVGCANKGESETPDEDASRSTTAMTAETAEAASDTAGTGPLPDACPLPPDVPCPATRLTRVPAGPGDGACVQSVDCLPNAACIQQTCRPFDEIDVTICVHQTAFTGHTCGGANLVRGVVLSTTADGGAYDGPYGLWKFEHTFTAAPRCAAAFAEGEACVVAPLDRLIYDGVIASPIIESGPIDVSSAWPQIAYFPGHLGTRAEILERLDAGCFDVPENNTVGHRSTVSIWGPQ